MRLCQLSWLSLLALGDVTVDYLTCWRETSRTRLLMLMKIIVQRLGTGKWCVYHP